MALFRIHEERILHDQASDKTLLYSLTLRIENGHEPVKQKARGENRVPQLTEHADNNSQAHVVLQAALVQFSMAASKLQTF